VSDPMPENILDEILEHKRGEVEAAKGRVSPASMADRAESHGDAARGLRRALTTTDEPRVIAEIKRRSPSRGEIRADFDAASIAVAYESAGAAALSVLTDECYFGGDLAFLTAARRVTSIPILRKDFTVDAYQIDEARVHGADAVLLIVAAFREASGIGRLAELHRRAARLGLDALVEVHDDAELDVALGLGADLIGINNRNLETFEVDLGTTERLAKRIPAGVVLVSESGIFTNDDIRRLERAGAGAFLVGESLMREPDVASALRSLRRNA